MITTSYKPAEGKLRPTPAFKEYQLEYFKGIKPKTVRMSGELFKQVDRYMTLTKADASLEESEHREMLANIIREFRIGIDAKDKTVKKRIYFTGYAEKKFQLMLTSSVYPVPHLPWAGISLITLDIGVPGSSDQYVKFISWSVVYDHETDANVIGYYNAKIKPKANAQTPLGEGLVDMIFEMTALPEKLTGLSLLAESARDEFRNTPRMNRLIDKIADLIANPPAKKVYSPTAL
jgi:hypothetical protein